MAELGSLHVSLSLDASNFNGTISQVNRQMKAMGGELQSIRAKGKDYEKSIEGLSQKQDVLQRSLNASSIKLQETRKRYDELVASGKASDAQIERAAIAVNRAQAEYNRLEKELQDVTRELKVQSSQWTITGNSLSELGSKLKSVGDSAKNIGRDLTMKLTAPIVGIGGAIVKTGMDFEASMSKVKALSGATAEDMKKLEAQAKELGATTSFSASQAAEGMAFLAMAGWETKDILAGMPGLLDLAASGAMDLGRAADITSNIMSAFSIEASKAGHVADVLAAASSNANTNVEQMGLAMTYLAPVANTLGWTLEEAAAAVMTMSDAGIQGEKAGAAFATSLQRLANPTNEMQKVMKQLKISFFDANGQIKPLPHLIAELEKATKNLTSEQQAAALSTLFGAEAYKNWAVLLESGSDILGKNTKMLIEADGAAKKMAETMLDNTKGAIVEFKSAVEGLAIQLSEFILPFIVSFVEKMTELVRKFSNLSPVIQTAVIGFGVFVAAIGPIAMILGALVASIGQIVSAFGAISLAAGQAGGMVALLTSKLGFLSPAISALTGPIGIVVAAIGGIVTAITIAYNKIDWFRNGVNQIFNSIKEFTSTIFSDIKDTISSLITSAIDYSQGILNKFKAFWESNGNDIRAIVELVMTTIKTRIEIVLGIIQGIFQTVWPIISSVVKVTFETIQMITENTLDVIIGIISAGMKLLQGDWKGAWESIKGIFENIMNNITNFLEDVDFVQLGKNIIQGFVNGITGMKDAIESSISKLMDAVNEFFGGKLEEFGTLVIGWFTSLPGLITSKLTEWQIAITNWFETMPSVIATRLEEWWTVISNWFRSMPERIVTKLIEWGVAIRNWAERQKEENIRQFSEWGNAIIQWLTSIPEEIKSKLTYWTTTIQNWFKSIPKEIATQLSEWWNTISKWFSDTYNGITSKLTEWGQSIKDWFTQMPSNISTWLTDWWKKIATWFSEIPARIKEKLEEWWTAIRDWFTAVPEKPEIKNMGKNMIDKVAAGNAEKKQEFIDKLGKIIVDVATGALAVAGIALLAAGREIIKRLVEGIQQARTTLSTKLTEIKNEIINRIKEIDLFQIGKDIIRGLINGIGSMFSGVKQKIDNLAQNIPEWAKKVLDIRSPSRVMMSIGRWVGIGLADGIESTKTNNQKVVQELGKIIIDASKSSQSEINKINENAEKERKKIQEDYAFKRMTLKKKTLESIQKLEREEAEKIAKINEKAQSDILKIQEKADSEKLKAIQNFIKQKKELEGLSLVDEAKIWEESLKHFHEGTEEKIQAQINYKNALKAVNDEIVSINQEYSNKILEVNENLKKQEKELTETYQKAVDDRAKSLLNFAGLFDEFDHKFAASGTKLLKNLESQVEGFKKWQEEIEKLSQRAIDEGLLEELRQMGPKALPEIMALNKLTDEQLTKYSDLYKEKSELARQQAVNEMEWLKQETDLKLSQLNAQTQIQLAQLQSEWASKIKSITKTTEEEFGSMYDIGVNAMRGLSDGLSSMEPKLMSQARSIANKIRREIERALDIRSPSRVMKSIGVYIGQGLIDGMEATVSQVAAASTRLAETATSGFGRTATSSTSIDNSRHFQPTVNIYAQSSGERAMERTLRKLAFEFN